MKSLSPRALISAIALIWVQTADGCSFDPWPEPDPGEDLTPGDYEEDAAPTDDSANDSDADADESDTDTQGGQEMADANAVFSSAPNPQGFVTVVGIPEAASGIVALVSGENGQSESFVVNSDGSFAGRMEASEGELLSIAILGEGGMSEPVTVKAGALEWGNVGDSIIGSGSGAGAPDSDSGTVAIQGAGDMLQDGLIIIGGNVDLSAGASADVSCDPQCLFELAIQGDAGDEIDLFLVRDGENSGVTDSQTVIVPES